MSSIPKLCRVFGKSRQAFYQMEFRRTKEVVEDELILLYVREIRKQQPRVGTRKLYALLKEIMKATEIKMGRDKFFALLRTHNLLVKSRRRRRVTTNSHHRYRKYPNLIKGYEPSGPEQTWVSDITYVTTKKGFVYVAFVTDRYSKKIMGYHVHPTLEARGPIHALSMALKSRRNPESGLIHHSDRGIQYCCDKYIKLLERNTIRISMSSRGNPYENAVAERVNGIFKTEFYLDRCFTNINQVKQVVKEMVAVYNNQRPHASCDYLTPEQAHHHSGVLKKRWRTYPSKSKTHVPQHIGVVANKALERIEHYSSIMAGNTDNCLQ